MHNLLSGHGINAREGCGRGNHAAAWLALEECTILRFNNVDEAHACRTSRKAVPALTLTRTERRF